MIAGEIPGTASNDPVVIPLMNAVTDDGGSPAAINAGGTFAGIVSAKRLLNTTVYTVEQMVLIVLLALPPAPVAVPISRWSSMTIVATAEFKIWYYQRHIFFNE